MATRVHGLRISDDGWTEVQRRAKAAGLSTNGYLVEVATGPPSFSAALETMDVVADAEGREAVLQLTEAPKLAAVTRRSLTAIGEGLMAVAARWPR